MMEDVKSYDDISVSNLQFQDIGHKESFDKCLLGGGVFGVVKFQWDFGEYSKEVERSMKKHRHAKRA